VNDHRVLDVGARQHLVAPAADPVDSTNCLDTMGLMLARIRAARAEDAARLDEIRRAAFASVFASFRSILGDEIYALAQARDDEAQGGLLAAMLAPESRWEVYVAEVAEEVVGFVSVRLDHDTTVGEIGLNAVDPSRSGKGCGTEMYNFALARMKEAGMKVATVGTGGDPSHEPARRAYRKAGFSAEIPTVWMYRKL
jgi:GNAT superfamily N-acetyltransferase